jgi:hypothetical protein
MALTSSTVNSDRHAIKKGEKLKKSSGKGMFPFID